MKIKVYKIKPSTNLNWHKEVKIKKCKMCGKLFSVKSKYNFCSDECYGRHIREYNAECKRKKVLTKA